MGNSILTKGKGGYGYNYTELAQINKYLAEMGLSYYQFIEAVEGAEYIYTIKVDEEGKESAPIRGCRVITGVMSGKTNVMQDYGAALTYARRYSLLLAYGLSTTDTDGLTQDEIQEKEARGEKPNGKKTTPKAEPKKAEPKKTEPKKQKAKEVYVMTKEREDLMEELDFYLDQLGLDKADVFRIAKMPPNSTYNEMETTRLQGACDFYRKRVETVIAEERAEKSGQQTTMVIGG